MASENPTSNVPEDIADKGKGKQVEDTAMDTRMDEDEDSSSSDEGEDVSTLLICRFQSICRLPPRRQQ